MRLEAPEKTGKLVAVITVISLFLFIGCSQRDDRRLQFLAETEPTGYDEVGVSSQRMDELREDIRRAEGEIEEAVQAYARSASFHKLLAYELIQAEMYGPALEALRRAMELQPANAVVYYYVGIASARTARAHMLDGEESSYLADAERHFREAIRLRPDYKDALFALAVLLAYDLSRPEDALTYSRRLSQIETGDPAVRFLHANILVRNGQIEEAIDIYDYLAQNAPSQEQRAQARDNRNVLEGGR